MICRRRDKCVVSVYGVRDEQDPLGLLGRPDLRVLGDLDVLGGLDVLGPSVLRLGLEEHDAHRVLAQECDQVGGSSVHEYWEVDAP
jgi:hypothetical protein